MAGPAARSPPAEAAKDGTRTRDVRRKRATAKNLAQQPKLAKAAATGKLSQEQLDHASDLAGDDPEKDEQWAEHAPNWSPEDLAAVGDDGEPIAVGRVESTLSEKTKRVVRQRDGTCRWPGCDQRIGLETHHLWPSSWGGADEIWNLAAVCWHHHHQLAPQGPWLLLGNPNHPAGLSLITRDDLPQLAQLAAEHARAGPNAA